MANIVGEGFSPFVSAQVKQRQRVYGSINRDNQILNYLNNKTGWIKLVSSVDVDPQVSTQRGIDLSGAELAKQYVLFNGTTNESPDRGSLETYQKSGIARDKSITNSNAYGLGGTEFGLRPMPGIIQASIKTETRGSLKTATVQVKANNRTQFDIIDLLYLRLGYTILLEWGHSSYFNNDGEFVSDNPYSLADDFLTAKYKYNDLYPEIQNRRTNSDGNYDAVVGKVINFNWTFNRDGTYDVTIIIRSMGDIIESLKSNILLPDSAPVLEVSGSTPNPAPVTPPEPTSESVIASFKDAHSIGKMFYDKQQKLASLAVGVNGISRLYNEKSDGSKIYNFIKQQYTGGDTQYYIRLGYFIDWIKSNIVPRIKGDKVAELIQFDTDPESNIIYLEARQLVTDPRICMFKSSWKYSSGESYSFFEGAETFTTYVNGNRYGKIMNLYYNFTYILELLKTLPRTPENSNGVGVYDLLMGLCQGFQTATGNFNSLEPKTSEEDNTVKLIDEVQLPDRDNFLTKFGLSTEVVEFDVYGYYSKDNSTVTAGFIRDISFQTTITNELATMVTIGATSNGYVVGQDATALSRMNNGLVDRIKSELENTQESSEQASSSSLDQDYKIPRENFNNFIKTIGSKGSATIPNWDVSIIENYSNTVSQFLEYDQAKQTQAAQNLNPTGSTASPNTGFLPFNLSLTLDGLSGIKVYQKYTIDSTYLPSNYPTSLEFLVSSITHNLQSNQWTTQIESFAVPKNPFGSGAQPELSTGRGNARGNVNTGTQGDFVGPTPNADRLRETLISLGYTEKGRELSNGGDITAETANLAIAVFKTIKNQLPSISIKVTGGNDAYHQRLGYTSRHSLGRGIDFVISPSSQENIDSVVKILQGYAAGNYPNVRFINEYASPTKAATAQHFHLSYGAGTEAASTAKNAKTLADQGKITSYNIA